MRFEPGGRFEVRVRTGRFPPKSTRWPRFEVRGSSSNRLVPPTSVRTGSSPTVPHRQISPKINSVAQVRGSVRTGRFPQLRFEPAVPPQFPHSSNPRRLSNFRKGSNRFDRETEPCKQKLNRAEQVQTGKAVRGSSSNRETLGAAMDRKSKRFLTQTNCSSKRQRK